MNDVSISKRTLWRFVNLKIKRIIHHYHVFSIITILFNEVISDLLKGNKIKIFNFGTLILKKLKPRRHFNIKFQKVMQAKGHKILRFTLAPAFRKKLVDHLDKGLKDD